MQWEDGEFESIQAFIKAIEEGVKLHNNPPESSILARDREFKSLYPDNESNILFSSEKPRQTMRLFCFHT